MYVASVIYIIIMYLHITLCVIHDLFLTMNGKLSEQ